MYLIGVYVRFNKIQRCIYLKKYNRLRILERWQKFRQTKSLITTLTKKAINLPQPRSARWTWPARRRRTLARPLPRPRPASRQFRPRRDRLTVGRCRQRRRPRATGSWCQGAGWRTAATDPNRRTLWASDAPSTSPTPYPPVPDRNKQISATSYLSINQSINENTFV